ncbi:hypothetical protein KR054_008050 [Drosophila jambulina]|nr:hypothetical protein KR054_008050 [Drosophila jambulina]
MGDLCEHVHRVVQSKRCEFVETNKDCLANIFNINYLRWHYCYVDERNKFNAFWSVLAMTFMVVYVFWVMQITVLNYFCPCLKVIADSCHLSQNTAGVTVLTMANGSPDLFVSIAARLVAGSNNFVSCVAQALFLNMFVGGVVMLTRPFEMSPNYYLRDFGFLFLNVVYFDYILKRPEGVSWMWAAPSSFIFIGYIVVAIVDQNLVAARIRKLERMRDEAEGDYRNEELHELEEMEDLPIHRQKIDWSHGEGGRNHQLFRQFWHSVYQFDKERFRRGTLIVRVYMLLQMPFQMFLRLLIPVVDLEKPLLNWSKLLFCWHLVIVPTYVTFLLARTAAVGGVPFYAIAALIMFPLSVLIFFLTRTDTPPRCFKWTCALSFIAIVMVIFGLLSEVNAMFFALATILTLSTQFATATAMCFALCSNDLVTNILLAKQGFSSMAYTATFSTPVLGKYQLKGVFFFSILRGSSMLCSPSGSFLPQGNLGETACTYMEVGLLFSLLCALTTNFHMRRACGFLLVTYYIFFLVVLFLVEFEVVGAYGF